MSSAQDLGGALARPVRRPAASPWLQLAAALRWTRSSYVLMSAFLATLFVIAVVWWPLVEQNLATFDRSRPWWVQMDWLLLGNFVAMSFLIMAGADLKADALIVLVGFAGGLVIESWGTQTNLWVYFTRQRPPLWIIPAWPIASLSIDRLFRLLQRLTSTSRVTLFRTVYWLIFSAFYALMLVFVWPTVGKSLTVMAILLCTFLILTPTDHRAAVLTFVAGAGLGYFLERWGTTRFCWTYYTRQTPPFFAVLAHGMAAVAFWRTALVVRTIQERLFAAVFQRRKRQRLEPGRYRVERAGQGDNVALDVDGGPITSSAVPFVPAGQTGAVVKAISARPSIVSPGPPTAADAVCSRRVPPAVDRAGVPHEDYSSSARADQPGSARR